MSKPRYPYLRFSGWVSQQPRLLAFQVTCLRESHREMTKLVAWPFVVAGRLSTGVQDGSVVDAILAHPTLSKEFQVQAITRDPSKPNAQALGPKGVETVKADLEYSESVTEALQGSYAVSAVTKY